MFDDSGNKKWTTKGERILLSVLRIMHTYPRLHVQLIRTSGFKEKSVLYIGKASDITHSIFKSWRLTSRATNEPGMEISSEIISMLQGEPIPAIIISAKAGQSTFVDEVKKLKTHYKLLYLAFRLNPIMFVKLSNSTSPVIWLINHSAYN